MKTVYLFRHAKSSWTDETLDDFDRPLAKRGRRAAEAMAHYVAKKAMTPQQILCSPAKRTRQTLECLQEIIDASVPTRFEKQIYMASAATLLRRLRRASDDLESVMLVGHNPGLEQLAGMLAHGGDLAAHRLVANGFTAGALAVIEADVEHWAELRQGCGRLKAFIRPKDLLRDAGALHDEGRPHDPL